MDTKLLEVRDRLTMIPCLAISTLAVNANHSDMKLLRRAGYSPTDRCILFGSLEGGPLYYASSQWPAGMARTLVEAHKWVEANWDTLESGEVIDVEFILGETSTKKIPEAWEGP